MSPHVVAGGLAAGSYLGAEEELCARSTLYFGLRAVADKAEALGLVDSAERPVHVPEDGVVIVPNVSVLREGAEKGYAALPSPAQLLVLGIAMPNLRPPETLSAVREAVAPPNSMSLPLFRRLIEQKMEAAVLAATRQNLEVLVVDEVGCGWLGNDTSLVGCALGRAFRLLPSGSALSEVVLCAGQEFQRAVRLFVGHVSS
eukprot:TRINITY_DN34991_c0_g1_i2.p1 TRINITY_DN34991_c0_g1~~TRINITY_DN34991_c0_g1_i2.p1  ORF type:complete len:201 (+),score=41.33 TRINITY_DN34991_c0_g1_i2:305-907(+)